MSEPKMPRPGQESPARLDQIALHPGDTFARDRVQHVSTVRREGFWGRLGFGECDWPDEDPKTMRALGLGKGDRIKRHQITVRFTLRERLLLLVSGTARLRQTDTHGNPFGQVVTAVSILPPTRKEKP